MSSCLTVAHLSDLHVRLDYRGTMLDREPRLPIKPDAYVLVALEQVARERPDVLVLTGDLVHEGSAEDYRHLREMLDSRVPGVPVIPVLGNHDDKAAFREGFLGERGEGLYTSVHELGGYRFVVLDTSAEGRVDGSLTGAQAAWLREVLREDSPNGTILLGHHPLLTDQPWFSTELDPGLIEDIAASDVIAYLCGHAHYLEARTIGTFLQFTGESFAFGVETAPSGDEIAYTEARAYNLCRIAGRDISVHTRPVLPFDPVLCRLATAGR